MSVANFLTEFIRLAEQGEEFSPAELAKKHKLRGSLTAVMRRMDLYEKVESGKITVTEKMQQAAGNAKALRDLANDLDSNSKDYDKFNRQEFKKAFRELSISVIFSTEDFPVSLSQACEFLEYSNFHHARRAVVNAFKQKKDYLLTQAGKQTFGKSNKKEDLQLSRACFRKLMISSRTFMGGLIQDYYLDLEEDMLRNERENIRQINKYVLELREVEEWLETNAQHVKEKRARQDQLYRLIKQLGADPGGQLSID